MSPYLAAMLLTLPANAMLPWLWLKPMLANAQTNAGQCYGNISHAPGFIACQYLRASPECMALCSKPST